MTAKYDHDMEDPDVCEEDHVISDPDLSEITLFMFGWFRFNVNIYVPPEIRLLCAKYCQSYFVKSNLINRISCENLLYLLNTKHLLKNYKSTKRVYCASLDGFDCKSLYYKMNKYIDCTNPSILIIKSNYGNIFGSYQSSQWILNSTPLDDDDVYLFSMTENKIFDHHNPYYYSICYPQTCDDGYLVFFGSPSALYLAQNCNNNNVNRCAFGSFGITEEIVLCGGTSHNYDTMSNTYQFTVIQFEIHQLQIK